MALAGNNHVQTGSGACFCGYVALATRRDQADRIEAAKYGCEVK
jgi:hypothetical protein